MSEQDQNIRLVVNPDDIRPWVARSSVFVCPILDGGGTRLKILDALAMGKAVVSTSIGCEGLRVEHGRNILIADAPGDFAAQILRVIDHKGLQSQIGAAGRALAEQTYNWEVIGADLVKAYRCALHRASCCLEPGPLGTAKADQAGSRN